MKHYPDLSGLSPADHLLFDTGFAAGLILRAKHVLREIAGCGDYPLDAGELLEAIEEFEAGRLQLRSEIYHNAAAAAGKGLVSHE